MQVGLGHASTRVHISPMSADPASVYLSWVGRLDGRIRTTAACPHCSWCYTSASPGVAGLGEAIQALALHILSDHSHETPTDG